MSSTVMHNQENDSMRIAIIECSRDLFAKYGYKKTTMEDIANALRKGKSSLYYYFKNKEEIFQAVLELEEFILFSRLKEIVASDIKPKEKLSVYVNTRMEIISTLQNYMRAMKEDLYNSSTFFEKLRLDSENEERRLIAEILKQGTNDGTFQMNNVNMGAMAITNSLRGLEGHLFQSLNNMDVFKTEIEGILNILFYGLIKR